MEDFEFLAAVAVCDHRHGQVGIRREKVDLDPGASIGVEHLIVLPPGDLEIEVQSDPLGALCNRIAPLPRKMIDGPDQDIAQGAVFAVDTPALKAWGTAALDSCSKLHD